MAEARYNFADRFDFSMPANVPTQNTAVKAGGLRPFVSDDIAPVADLIWRVLHGHQEPAPASLHNHLQELFLSNPWMDDGIVSRVFQDSSSGKIIGFFGAVPRRMSLQGRRIRLAFGSNFVVDPGNRASMIALQLVKAFMKGPQDVSITDSANDMSRPLLRSLGFSVIPIYSLQWARPLRPAQYAVQMFNRMKKRRTTILGSLAQPFCRLADAMAVRMPFSPLRQTTPVDDQELDNEALLQCLTTIPGKQGLLPEYDISSLNWVLDFIARRKVLEPIRKAAVRDGSGKIVGWYVYTIPVKGGIGEVMQIGSQSPSVGMVLDHLFSDAWKHGLSALHGRMEPQFMQELTSRSCLFFRHGSWTLVQSTQPDLLSLLQSGTAFFSRLDGEWCFRHGGAIN